MNGKQTELRPSLAWAMIVVAVIGLVGIIATTNTLAGGLFSKTMPDGSTLSLEKTSHVELRNEPVGGLPTGLPTNAVFIAGRYITDTYKLIFEKAGVKATVWEKKHTDVEGMIPLDLPRFELWDVEKDADKVYVLLVYDGRILFDIQGKDSQVKWYNVSSDVIKNMWGGESGKISGNGKNLKVIITDANGKNETLTQTETANGRVWVSDRPSS